MHNFARSTALLSLALLTGACTDETTDPGANEFRTTGFSCTNCGFNSPDVNDFPIPELHVDAVPNEAGVQLLGILDPNDKLFRVAIVDDEFHAFDNEHNLVASGEDVVGWRLQVKLPNDDENFIWINAIDAGIPSWATGAKPITGYALAYFDTQAAEWHNVCPESGTDTTDIAATLIGDELYDRAAKTVAPDQTGWFTIACRDEAVYKMKLMNYGPNDDFTGNGDPATVDQRQATIKMITADYCGDGTSYTAQGTPLLWQNAGGWVDIYPLGQNPAPLIEAEWTSSGATCLSNPRHVDIAEVACALPACPTNNQPHEWTTWLP